MDSKVALNINWNFGFNKDVINGVHNLSSNDRNAIFYVSSHSGVIYDYEFRRQTILQGHCNIITCCAVSKDKRWIVTADEGEPTLNDKFILLIVCLSSLFRTTSFKH